jgi:hypothetical protein
MATKVGLKDRLKARAPALFEALYKDYRPELDSRITVLDLSYEALKVNIYRGSKVSAREIVVYNRVYEVLQQVVREALAKRTYASLEDPKLVNYFSAKNSTPYPILVDGGKSSFFVVAKNFDAIRNFVTKNISKDPRLKSSRFGEVTRFEEVLNRQGIPSGDYKKTTRSKVDIGHIPSEDNPNLTSPLEEKLQSVLEVAASTGNQRLADFAKQSLKQLYDIQASISYDFRNTAPEAIATARRVLGEGYVVVTLHTEKKNNTFSAQELQIFNKLVAEMALSIGLDDVPGSNTIVEDIAQAVELLVRGKQPKLKSHTKQTATEKTKKTRSIKIKPVGVKSLPPNVTKQTQSTSLAELQAILDALLVDRVKQNMGTGSRRDILNLRTGRFAESVDVQKLSISRAGMITAFYTYMKNPYATFSQGGARANPSSRDPKLLISKSIRELLADRVANRLRAVLV